MTVKKESESTAMHHWMFAAQVVYTDDKDADGGGVITQNAMLLTAEQHINAAALAQAQRTLQANVLERCANPTGTKIIDVVFLNISYLGFMTKEGFNPKGAVKPA